MAQYDPDYQQALQVTSRGFAQQHFVPQTTMSNGYNNNHVKNNVQLSDMFANDSNDKNMRHVGRFKATYADNGRMNRAGTMRFVSRSDEL